MCGRLTLEERQTPSGTSHWLERCEVQADESVLEAGLGDGFGEVDEGGATRHTSNLSRPSCATVFLTRFIGPACGGHEHRAPFGVIGGQAPVVGWSGCGAVDGGGRSSGDEARVVGRRGTRSC